MKKKYFNFTALLMLGGVLFTTSCSEETKPKEEQVENHIVEDIVEIDEIDGVDVDELEISSNINYKVPTPNELFSLIKETGVKFDESILNNVDNLSKYNNSKSQALNFGVYSADLAFISSYEIGTEALKYFKTIRQLTKSLDVSNAFDGTVFKRIEENVSKDNKDSLLVLSNETYYKAFTYLEENGREKALSYIVIGGWIESLYVLTQVDEFKEGSLLSEKIGDQKLTLENIMGMVMEFQDDDELMDVVSELADLDMVFSNLEQVDVGAIETTKQDDGKFVFSGGEKTLVKQEDFGKIKVQVEAIRTEIVDGNL